MQVGSLQERRTLILPHYVLWPHCVLAPGPGTPASENGNSSLVVLWDVTTEWGLRAQLLEVEK